MNIKYEATDGKLFNTEEECTRYEKSLSVLNTFKSFICNSRSCPFYTACDRCEEAGLDTLCDVLGVPDED